MPARPHDAPPMHDRRLATRPPDAVVTVATVSVLAVVLEDGSQAITVSLAVAAGTAVWSLFVWVLFGWFEHTLTALVAITRNTAAVMPPPQYDVPPAPYEPTT